MKVMDDTFPQTQSRTTLRRPVRTFVQQEQKEERIKTWQGAGLIIMALSVDGFQAILTAVGIGLVLGPIISVIAYFSFWIFFMMLGVSFVKSPKKLGVVGGTAIIETLLSFLPGMTAGVAALVFMTWAEDKGGIIGQATGLVRGKIK